MAPSSNQRWSIATGVRELAGRSIDELSSGQRQQAWIAMVLVRPRRPAAR